MRKELSEYLFYCSCVTSHACLLTRDHEACVMGLRSYFQQSASISSASLKAEYGCTQFANAEYCDSDLQESIASKHQISEKHFQNEAGDIRRCPQRGVNIGMNRVEELIK